MSWRSESLLNTNARLVVLSGPSAVGKGTVAGHIISHNNDFDLSVSATTRAARPGEVDALSYFFVSAEEFSRMIEANELLEWATVHGKHRYGTPRLPVEKSLHAGKHVLLEIDVQGAFQVKQSYPSALLVFVNPPTFDELEKRMKTRGTEGVEDRLRRLETAKSELLQANLFDFQVVNDEVARCAKEVVDLVESN
jgi:guanylate kinase